MFTFVEGGQEDARLSQEFRVDLGMFAFAFEAPNDLAPPTHLCYLTF